MPKFKATLFRIAKRLLPPVAVDFGKTALDHLRPAPVECLVAGWPQATRGWNVESIARLHEERWPAYLETLKGISPLGIDPTVAARSTGEVDIWDIINHNNLMSFAYVLGLAAHGRQALSMLDWGGGVGQYCPLSQALLPGLKLEYHCQDMPVFCAVGRRNLPEATFWEEPDGCFVRSYDLVFAGSSLWYAQDWRTTLGKMAASSSGHVFVNRMLFVQQAASFVAIQRPGKHAYDTEYPMWIFNRGEFLDAAKACGLVPVREFIIAHGPRIHRAPEQGTFRGFLFRRA